MLAPMDLTVKSPCDPPRLSLPGLPDDPEDPPENPKAKDGGAARKGTSRAMLTRTPCWLEI